MLINTNLARTRKTVPLVRKQSGHPWLGQGQQEQSAAGRPGETAARRHATPKRLRLLVHARTPVLI